jgi:hypothetical protein
MSQIAANIENIRARMARACLRAGRDPGGVRLMAVSKFVEQDRIAEAIDAGVTLFGENRAQEFRQKQTFFEIHSCHVHFIGQLQTNKIKYICGTVDTVQSVDRLPLAQALSARAVDLGCVQDVMIQVNIGEEAQKGGITGDDLGCFMRQITALDGIRVLGLMCVPPALEPEAVRPYYVQMRKHLCQLMESFPDQPIRELSMGMSHDFEVAIEEGATIVRIGTGVFGTRRTSA